MELHVELNWDKGSSYSLRECQRLLSSYEIGKEEVLKTALPVVKKKLIAPVAFAVRCGSSKHGSMFVFMFGSPKISVVVGWPTETQSLEDLEDDWEFLERILKEENVKYKVKYAHFRINSKKIVRFTFLRFAIKRENLAFVSSSSGLVPLVVALSTSTYKLEVGYSSIVGFIAWLGIVYYSFWKKGGYELET